MGEVTRILWAHHTFNPIIGCQKVSPGCDHCYAETLATRYGWATWGPPKNTRRHVTAESTWKQPMTWERKAARDGVRRRVFCGSLCDVGEEHPDWIAPRRRLVDLIAATPHLDWLLLTKRPKNFLRLFPWGDAWPANVWAGTSVESQRWADIRIPVLLKVPARVRFLSCEPLLGPVDLRPYLPGLQWVIVGGESGPGARPMDVTWAQSLRDQCRAAGVAYFFKQHGGRTPDAGGHLLDGRVWQAMPATLADTPPACPICGAALRSRPKHGGWHRRAPGVLLWYCPVAQSEETQDAEGRRVMIAGALHPHMALYPDGMFAVPPSPATATSDSDDGFPF